MGYRHNYGVISHEFKGSLRVQTQKVTTPYSKYHCFFGYDVDPLLKKEVFTMETQVFQKHKYPNKTWRLRGAKSRNTRSTYGPGRRKATAPAPSPAPVLAAAGQELRQLLLCDLINLGNGLGARRRAGGPILRLSEPQKNLRSVRQAGSHRNTFCGGLDWWFGI